jgi:hypothetical protein
MWRSCLKWFDRVGADADIAGLGKDFSEVRWHSFADWAGAFDWSVVDGRLLSPEVAAGTSGRGNPGAEPES